VRNVHLGGEKINTWHSDVITIKLPSASTPIGLTMDLYMKARLVVVAKITKGSAADRAGIVVGQVISQVNGTNVRHPAECVGIIAAGRKQKRKQYVFYIAGSLSVEQMAARRVPPPPGRVRSGPILHKCPLCDYQTIRKPHMRRHTRSRVCIKRKEYLAARIEAERARLEKPDPPPLSRAEAEAEADEKPFLCKYCGYRSAWQHALYRHMERMHGEDADAKTAAAAATKAAALAAVGASAAVMLAAAKPHACRFCDYRTARSHDLSRHLERMHEGLVRERKQKMFTCKFCDHKSVWKNSLKQHLKVKHGVKRSEVNKEMLPFELVEKRSSSASDSSESDDAAQATDNCQFCTYTSKVPSALTRHVSKMHADQCYQCKWCKYKSVWKNAKRRHEMMVHPQEQEEAARLLWNKEEGEEAARLVEKERRRKKRRRLREKRRQEEEEEAEEEEEQENSNEEASDEDEAFECEFCEYTTTKKYALNRHVVRVHAAGTAMKGKNAKWKCRYCEYTSNWKYALKRHVGKVHQVNVEKYRKESILGKRVRKKKTKMGKARGAKRGKKARTEAGTKAKRGGRGRNGSAMEKKKKSTNKPLYYGVGGFKIKVAQAEEDLSASASVSANELTSSGSASSDLSGSEGDSLEVAASPSSNSAPPHAAAAGAAAAAASSNIGYPGYAWAAGASGASGANGPWAVAAASDSEDDAARYAYAAAHPRREMRAVLSNRLEEKKKKKKKTEEERETRKRKRAEVANCAPVVVTGTGVDEHDARRFPWLLSQLASIAVLAKEEGGDCAQTPSNAIVLSLLDLAAK
jgi:KRAB domain-containing zinc finger protein